MLPEVIGQLSGGRIYHLSGFHDQFILWINDPVRSSDQSHLPIYYHGMIQVTQWNYDLSGSYE